MKPSKAGSGQLTLTNPNTAALELQAGGRRPSSKYKVGKTTKVVTVDVGEDGLAQAGRVERQLSLSKTAKSLLKPSASR